MKKTIYYIILFLSTNFLITLHSQEQANASKWNADGRFGVGVGYNVLNLLKQDGMFFQRYKLHPLEIDFRYRLDNHNHIYMNIPIASSKQDYSKETVLVDQPCLLQMTDRNKILGIGLGYNYNHHIYKCFHGFIGLGTEYMKQKITQDWKNIGGTFPKEEENSQYKYNNNIYSIIPQTGIQCKYKCWEVEMKYKLYASAVKNSNLHITQNDEVIYNRKHKNEDYRIEDRTNILHEGKLYYYSSLSLSLYYFF